MTDMLFIINKEDEIMWKRALFFVGGMVFGSAGFKLLGSKDAKNCYTKALAAGMRGYDALAKSGQKLQSGAEEIVANAKEINEERKLQEAEENGEIEF